MLFPFSVDFGAGTFHRPRSRFARRISRSRSICSESAKTCSLLPETSCHSMGTSATGIRSYFASSNSSTSKIHVARCWTGNICCAARRENSLKPHWVSRMCPTPTMRRMVWRPYISTLRIIERCTRATVSIHSTVTGSARTYLHNGLRLYEMCATSDNDRCLSLWRDLVHCFQ